MTEYVTEDDGLVAVNLRLLLLLEFVNPCLCAETCIFDFLSLFCLAYYIEGIVDIRFQGVDHAGILLKLPCPAIYQGDILRADLCRESEFVHLYGGSHFHNKSLVAVGIVARGMASLHHHSLTGETLLMTCC